ncbi:MAG: methyltransferase domain-containing protein [Proteobacteria bacterium]|nr:methyltransferase domain-containing protein [Pseudomonadota bacterium]
MSETHPVAAHYTRGDLGTKILDALAAEGKDLAKLTIDDLAPYDEFHILGREATIELANWAGLTESDQILDVGSGIGGPLRYLAATFGCQAIGIDLTSAYCDLANMLAERVGLAGKVTYRQADALAMPFEDKSFDMVWSQHAAMNIADRGSLCREMHRVLKPGGKLVLYDICRGLGEDVLYPVPWASDPAISFLITPLELRDFLEEAGFLISYFHDATREATPPPRDDISTADQPPPAPPGVRFAMGEDWKAKVANLRQNLGERRIAVVQVVALRK